MEQDIKKMLQRELYRETDALLEKIDSVQDLQEVHAPEEMRQNIFCEIREMQEEQRYNQLSEEDLKFIELGKIYAKKKKRRKYKVILAAAVLSVAMGMTALGEPERYFGKFREIFVGQEHTQVNSEEGVEINQNVTEAEAYQQIEETFGFFPVRLYYLPEDIVFDELLIGEEAQYAQMIFEGLEQNQTILFYMRPDYRESSIGNNVESEVLSETKIELENTIVTMKEFQVEENEQHRIQVTFDFQDVSYYLEISNIDYEEVKKITKNLYFS